MLNRIDLTIPVNSMSVKDFIHRDDEHSIKNTTDRVLNFIEGCQQGLVNRFQVNEIVKNAYEAYIVNKAKTDDCLKLEVVVKASEKRITVKIKDNGEGFVAAKKKYLNKSGYL